MESGNQHGLVNCERLSELLNVSDIATVAALDVDIIRRFAIESQYRVIAETGHLVQPIAALELQFHMRESGQNVIEQGEAMRIDQQFLFLFDALADPLAKVRGIEVNLSFEKFYRCVKCLD